MERFFGVLVEHYGGAFPLWLSPVQAMVIPIADHHLDYAREVRRRLREAGLRVEVDDSMNSMQKKIRENARQKIPYLLVVGDREEEAETVKHPAPGREAARSRRGRRVHRAGERGNCCQGFL